MKKLTLILVVLAAVFVAACSAKKEETAPATEETAAADEWPEMDAYHFAMAEAFHPFKDSANLAPVKAQAADLVKAAETWVNAPLPEKVNNDEIKAKLQELKTGSDALAQLVTTGTDEEIGTALTALHDKFHELQEAWYGGGDHHHDH
jgi:PBP1b-binding outer membrane lipoprotein LpoB